MKIIQLLPSIRKGDAVSNDAIQMDKLLQEAGYETGLYADAIGSGLGQDMVRPAEVLPPVKEQDILLYHLSIGSRLHERITSMRCRKIFVYHNITPSHFFAGYNPYLEQKCRRGLIEIQKMQAVPDYVLAVSEYNKAHLRQLGYKCRIDILPILFSMEDYDRSPAQEVVERYQDGYCNVLFTSRISPNKKQEDLIAAFYEYHRLNPHSRLFIVGNDAGTERYRDALKQYAGQLGMTDRDVIFTGQVSFEEILAYYRVADLFLCLSEHEGFCVPLLEAMHFEVPVIAYDAGAVKETLGGSGILLEEKSPQWVAQVMDVLYREEEMKRAIQKEQKERLKDFDYRTNSELFLKYIRQFAEGNEENKDAEY